MMRKNRIILTAAALIAGILTGCGSSAALSDMKTDKYVTLGEYKGLEASAPKAEVTEEDVENQIEQTLASVDEIEPSEVTQERPAQKWDTVIIDFVGKMDGEEFEGGASEDYPLTLGAGQFIPGFEDGLIGAQNGETRELELSFPETYQNAELAGKPVVFTVTVKQIAKKLLTDENASILDPECAGAEEYRQKVRASLEESAESNFSEQIENILVEQVRENSEFKSDPPKEMVDQYVERVRKNLQMMADYNNTTFANVLMLLRGITEDQFEEAARPDALATAQESIMLQAIANQENLNPTDEELEQMLEEEAKDRGFESAEKYKEAIDEENYRDYIMVRRVMDFIKENAEITAVPAEQGTAEEAPAEAGTQTPEETQTQAETSEAGTQAQTEEAE